MTGKHTFLWANVGLWAIAIAVLVWVGTTGRQPSPTGEGEPGLQTAAAAIPGLLPAPTVGPDGLFVEDFYRASTGDLAKDLELATGEGKLLAVFWERDGCEYCYRLHMEMLRDPLLHAYVADKFYTVRMDFYGRGTVRDFDGEAMTEGDVARRHRVIGTPTMEFRTAGAKEVLRVPGLVDADILLAVFEYADTGAYANGNINDWLRARGQL